MTNMVSVTRELKKTITNVQIRKNVSCIYLGYDEDFEQEFYEITFKKNTVKSQYSMEYMTSTTCPKSMGINGWLKEIAFVGEADTFRY